MNHRTHLTILALVGTMLGAGVSAGAQSAQTTTTAPQTMPGQGHRHGHGMMARALAGLNLTPAEKAQIKAAHEKFKAARTSTTPETHAQLKSDVEAALTPAQRTQFEANLKTMRQEKRSERAAAAPMPMPSAT